MRFQDVPLPVRMKTLELDPRGYPIPYIVQRDRENKPLFAANDNQRSRECIAKKMCPICGCKLPKELWFVGGPLSAFHAGGYYHDSAMHHECMQYALMVCPYLALRYRPAPADVTINRLQERVDAKVVLKDNTLIPDKPKVLCAVMAFGQTVVWPTKIGHIKPLRPYHKVEFWKDGEQLNFVEGLNLVFEVTAGQIGPETFREALRLAVPRKGK